MIYKINKFFKYSTRNKEALLRRIINKSKETLVHVSSITIEQVKSRVSRTLNQIDRVEKICWAIETKVREYHESGRLKHYSACDIHRMVNSIFTKKDARKPYATSTLKADIRALKGLGLIYAFVQPLGKGKGGFSFYSINYKKWKDYKAIIRKYYEDRLIADLADKRIKGIFIEKIRNLEYEAEENLKTRNEQPEEKKLSNDYLQNIPLLSYDKISLLKYKNSKKSILKKQKKEKQRSDNSASKAGMAKKRSGNKISYKKTYEEYMECRLKSVYKVDKDKIAKIRCNSGNINTYRNALRNLEVGITAYAGDYLVEHITEHFTKEFVDKYKDKIWMMNPNTEKVNDFSLIWGRFTDKYMNKYKQQEIVGRITYSDGYGNVSEVDKNGRFTNSKVKSMKMLLDEFRENIDKGSVYDGVGFGDVKKKNILLENQSSRRYVG
ncbi:plasmid maintenance protein [Borrelia sp. A-FGy1]|uniref:plasmid maintenance protein n=1 Tax=Borrelia sp. A-FGy1 TaxID=2608247 RepID=UPI0015F771C1|nr:plasmid maintenance protein [Borrelia sp. A-FGy1]